MNMRFWIWIALLLLLPAHLHPQKQALPEPGAASARVSFQRDIQPIFQAEYQEGGIKFGGLNWTE